MDISEFGIGVYLAWVGTVKGESVIKIVISE
jgi:hypothetical protein